MAKLLDLPNELLEVIIKSLLPGRYASAQKDLPSADQTSLDQQTSPSGRDFSLFGLSSLNQANRRLHAVTNPSLWEHVSCTTDFDWEAVGPRVDGVVKQIWLEPRNEKSKPGTIRHLRDRFPGACIIELGCPIVDRMVIHQLGSDMEPISWTSLSRYLRVGALQVRLTPSEIAKMADWRPRSLLTWFIDIEGEQDPEDLGYIGHIISAGLQGEQCQVTIHWEDNLSLALVDVLYVLSRELWIVTTDPQPCHWGVLSLRVKLATKLRHEMSGDREVSLFRGLFSTIEQVTERQDDDDIFLFELLDGADVCMWSHMAVAPVDSDDDAS